MNLLDVVFQGWFRNGSTRVVADIAWQGWFAPAGGFPTQYSGLRVWYGAVAHDLCLVAAADYHAGMGGAPMLKTPADVKAIYLVETTDPNASPIRIQTSAGIKAVRVKT